MQADLQSTRYEVPATLEAIEYCFDQRWTDGLPVVPPTPDKVRAFLQVAGLQPDAVIGEIPERGRVLTAEKVAINAVMAGCLPAYFPTVVASVQALSADEFGLYGLLERSTGAALLLVANGPLRRAIGLSASFDLFGPDRRPNATIGRALRLILQNVGAFAPIPVHDLVSDQTRASREGLSECYCLAEAEEHCGWEPLHVERGLAADLSAVTVMAAETRHLVRNAAARAPEELLATLADVIAHASYVAGPYLVALGTDHRALVERGGWSKADVRAYLARHARRSLADLKRLGRVAGAPAPGDAQRLPPLVDESDLLVVAAGGPAEAYSLVVTPWAGGRASRPVTWPVPEGVDGDRTTATSEA
jgi:hypothetical protein